MALHDGRVSWLKWHSSKQMEDFMTTGTAKLRQNDKITPAEWQLLEEMGYVRLGVVLIETEID